MAPNEVASRNGCRTHRVAVTRGEGAILPAWESLTYPRKLVGMAPGDQFDAAKLESAAFRNGIISARPARPTGVNMVPPGSHLEGAFRQSARLGSYSAASKARRSLR